MQAYDIILNENNGLEVETFNVSLKRNERNNAFYSFDSLGSMEIDPKDLPEAIGELKQTRAFSVTNLEPTPFGMEEGSIGYLVRSLVLPFGNKLLERVYDEAIIDGVCHILIYVTYVNVNTGEIFALRANDLGVHSEELEEKAKSMGFKHISTSFLGNYITTLDSTKQKPFSLTRSK